MKLYYMYDEDFIDMRNLFISNTKDQFELIEIKIESPKFNEFTPDTEKFGGGIDVWKSRVNNILNIINENMDNTPFIFSDIDIVFYKPIMPTINSLIERNDILFLRELIDGVQEGQGGNINFGFNIIRSNQKTYNFFSDVMNELEKNDDIILFIDEIHTIVGAGGATGSLDASNMFKPALARGEIQCVGATTLDEYRQYIEKDGALERRFQKVIVEPTTVDETILILNNIKGKYEDHHNVSYTPEAIEACVKLTSRYMTDRFLPDKAIDALDEAGSRVHITNIEVPKQILVLEKQLEEVRELKNSVVKKQKFEEAAKLRDDEKKIEKDLAIAQEKWEEDSKLNRVEVTEDNVADVVSMMTGIPVNRIAQTESNKLAKLPELIKGKVIGQDEAVQKIAKSIQRNRAGLKDPNKPIGSFIFLGSTGVGKTQLAKVLAKELFDSEDALIPRKPYYAFVKNTFGGIAKTVTPSEAATKDIVSRRITTYQLTINPDLLPIRKVYLEHQNKGPFSWLHKHSPIKHVIKLVLHQPNPEKIAKTDPNASFYGTWTVSYTHLTLPTNREV